MATDPQGNRYYLHVFTEYADASDSGGPGEIPVRAIIKTQDGQPVNRQDKGKYEIAATGLELTSTDPAAF
jgi:hypothetical protein